MSFKVLQGEQETGQAENTPSYENGESSALFHFLVVQGLQKGQERKESQRLSTQQGAQGALC